MKILYAFLIAFGFFAISLLGFSIEHSILIGIVTFLVTLWTNEALPLGIVSLIPLVLFPAFGIIDVNEVVPNYSKTIIFLFIGGFMIAIAIEKIGLHRYFSAKLLNLNIFSKTPIGIIYALAITAALLSTIFLNTTVTLMLLPVGLFLTENPKLKVRFLLAIAYGATIGGITTPIGTAPNMLLLGFLENQGFGVLTFWEWVFMVFPIASLMLFVVPYILAIGVENECTKDINTEVPKLNNTHKRLLYMLGILVTILFINTILNTYYGNFVLNESLIFLGFGILLFIPKIGFLEWEDTKKIPYEIIFLFGAGFSIATAFLQTGLAENIADKISFVFDMPLFWMFLIVALFISFSTEITSNTALTAIALPVFYELTKNMGNDGVVIMMVVTIATSCAFMLPIATPPNAIVMSSKVIKASEMFKLGFFVNLVGAISIALVGYFLWK